MIYVRLDNELSLVLLLCCQGFNELKSKSFNKTLKAAVIYNISK